MLGSFWDYVGIMFGIILGSFCDYLRIILGSFWDYFRNWEGFYSREVGIIRFNLHPLINHPPVGPPHSILHDFLLGRPADGQDQRFNLHPFINQHQGLICLFLLRNLV